MKELEEIVSVSNYQDAYEAGKLAVITRIDGAPVAIGVGQNGEHVMLKLDTERHQPGPSAKRGSVSFFDEDSFVNFVDRHKTEGTEVYIDRQATTIVAVLDGHGPAGPGWHRFRASLLTRQTPEWKAWVAMNSQQVTQIKIAEFIENHVTEIAQPTGADLLQAVKSLTVRRNVNFESAIDLDNGQTQVIYHENIDGTVGKQQMVFPSRFTLGLVPFEGADSFRVDARLRYRLGDGKIGMWFDLIEPHRVLDAAFDERVKNVVAGLEVLTPAVPHFFGTPITGEIAPL